MLSTDAGADTPHLFNNIFLGVSGKAITIRDDALLIHGDCRKIGNLPLADAILTDPVWPKALSQLPGSNNPQQLLAEAIDHLTLFLKPNGRIIVQLRCDSDVRLLQAIPDAYPFVRIAWLPYAVPTRRGRMLLSGDVGYLFGTPPKSRIGNHVLPGEMPGDFCPRAKFDNGKLHIQHPCPRHLAHVEWLVEKFTTPGELILDPFMGSCTTGVAALRRGRSFIGIEIDQTFFDEAVTRLQAEPPIQE
jgi:hypothetical protein